MAETYLYDIGQSVLKKLASLALEEFFLAWGLHNEVEEIKNTMVAINAVLLDAEQRQSQNNTMEAWLRELKDVLYDLEDVVDEFECESQRRQVEFGITCRKVCEFFSTSNPLVYHFQMAHMVKNIKVRLDRIAATRSNFGLTEMMNNMPNIIHKAKTHSFVRKEDVIGREDDQKNIINMLLQPIDDENVSIFAIVGIGGLGKTTLAKFVYNDEGVTSHFEKNMWVCVSEEFELRKLVIQILQCLDDENRKYVDMQIDRLQKVLRETLEKKRYLLILDDVWNEDPIKWLELKELLLGGNNGSRIVVTTRSNRVADIMGTMSPYNLHDLSHDHCLSLFFRYALKEEKGKQNPQLIKIGEEIVRKCNGVPLAVITLATLLNSSTDKRDWESIRNSEIWRLEQRENDILPALRLSYIHLPPHLKRCFAYCSIFPKDYVFKEVELVYLWMANGLVQCSSANQELEEIGFRYFKELSFRCFFQDLHEGIFATSCGMHDLMHDLAISVTRNEISTLLSSDQEISRGVRHFSFADPKSFLSYLPKYSQNLYHVRTVLFRDGTFEGFTEKQFFETCFSSCHYLRYLNLSAFEIENLPDSICNLKHLRYLNLQSSYYLKRLPNSICKLRNLQMLHLGGCEQLEELPRNIRGLISLRYLIINTTEQRLPNGRIGCLNSLRYLTILLCIKLEYLFEDMEGLQMLGSLNIIHCARLLSLPKSLRSLTSLHSLTITFCENLDLKMEESENNQHSTQFSLQNLHIIDLPRLEEFPEWLLQRSTNSLQFLTVQDCPKLKQVPEWIRNIPTLQKLTIKRCPLIENSVQIQEESH